MNLLVIGATGFTGSHVVQRLAGSGHRVRCLLRTAAKKSRLPASFESIDGSLEDPASLDRAMAGIDVLVNIASLGFGHAPVILDRARAAGIRRAVFVSTTSLFTQLNAPSKVVRLAAEQAIQDSQLDYVILRPTMIYGTAEDRNICRLIRYLQRFAALPIVGSGNHQLQPIHVGDLADVICQAALTEGASRVAVNVSGEAPLTFNQLVETISSLLGRRTWKIHLPVRPIVALLRFVERLRLRLPIKSEQILRLNENKAFDHSEATRLFGFRPRSFQAGVREEIRGMGLGTPT
jgi:nucleoside-diphosphate-sugar epimerase